MAEDVNRAKAFYDDIDNQSFWDACDQDLIDEVGERKAKYWLGMLEDPDPEDLIFVYQRIIRNLAFNQGYIVGRMADAVENIKLDI